MSHSIATRRGYAEGQTLTPSLPLIGVVPAPAVPTLTDPARYGWLCVLADDAIKATIGRQEAAARLSMSESVLSRQLTMQDGKCLNLARLGELGDAVVIEFTNRIRSHFGLDDPSTRVQHAMNLVTQGMALLAAEVKR